jgi:hypothetical protein
MDAKSVTVLTDVIDVLMYVIGSSAMYLRRNAGHSSRATVAERSTV